MWVTELESPSPSVGAGGTDLDGIDIDKLEGIDHSFLFSDLDNEGQPKGRSEGELELCYRLHYFMWREAQDFLLREGDKEAFIVECCIQVHLLDDNEIGSVPSPMLDMPAKDYAALAHLQDAITFDDDGEILLTP